MPTLRRVTVHELRNVKPGSSFSLSPKINVLLGRNGSGKTTLLRWLSDFLVGQMSDWAKESYHVKLDFSFQLEGEDVEMEVEAVHRAADVSEKERLFETLLATPSNGTGLPRDAEIRLKEFAGSRKEFRTSTQIRFAYNDRRFKLELSPQESSLFVDGELAKSVKKESETLPFWSLLVVIATPLIEEMDISLQSDLQKNSFALVKITAIFWRVYGSALRFDEGLEWLAAGMETPTMVLIDPEASPPSLKVFEDRNNIFQSAFGSLELPHDRKLPPQEITWTSNDLSFLQQAVALFEYAEAQVSLTLRGRAQNGLYRYDNLRFYFTRHDGSTFRHDDLSYGQQRLLSFLYYLALNPEFIIVDELVNGLHHAWLDECMKQIGDRQGLLTSQNPLLFDYLEFESVEDVRTRFVLCSVERDGDSEQLVWRNPSEDEARSFFTAYEAGIQHVSEILSDKGLW
ncbi:conserved hypothetical protein [Haliangium ochraceum DSM 14365]|uniref:ATPase AAA-type core domain-containing protein n=1 Tax=Haliangium ochraceum (strain DSM 14365 / JCM 11303 / SMP-2) TaxID=502025 RepID=D0LY30_HALO1|nr:conserved hypothetical protein [Haliangium ochraceum DSM 14365]